MPDFALQALQDIAPFILIGFAAQIVDGALGMAFGVVAQTLLVGLFGMSPASASATVHLVEVFTTGASGASHAWHRNIDWGLFRRLAPFAVAGGIAGAYIISNLDASVARPLVLAYLVVIGVLLLIRAIRMRRPIVLRDPKATRPLALVGGFLDAAGGGGWGPVVASSLLVQGSDPRLTVGTVNATEFLLAVTISLTFVLTLSVSSFGGPVVGLIIGGILAAPFGAIIVKRVSPRFLLFAVAAVLIATSLYAIVAS